MGLHAAKPMDTPAKPDIILKQHKESPIVGKSDNNSILLHVAMVISMLIVYASTNANANANINVNVIANAIVHANICLLSPKGYFNKRFKYQPTDI